MVNGRRVEEEASTSRQSWDDTDMVIPIESRATDDRAESVLLIRRLSTASKVQTHAYH